MAQIPPKLMLRRLSATALDLLLGALLGLLLSNSAIGSFFADRAVVMLKIDSADTVWKGPVPMVLGILGPFVYVLPLSILLALLTEPLIGTSAGKSLLGLEIAPCGNATFSKRRLWYRAASKTIVFWGLIVALLAGNWVLALCSAFLGLALLGSIALSLFSSVRPIHETLSLTCIIRKPALGR